MSWCRHKSLNINWSQLPGSNRRPTVYKTIPALLLRIRSSANDTKGFSRIATLANEYRAKVNPYVEVQRSAIAGEGVVKNVPRGFWDGEKMTRVLLGEVALSVIRHEGRAVSPGWRWTRFDCPDG